MFSLFRVLCFVCAVTVSWPATEAKATETNAADTNAVTADAAEPTRRKPNIVFIYCDDLGFGDLACHGHPRIRTPHIDQLAQEGTDFRSFTVVNPVCSPSRTGIVTGQFPSRWGVHQHFATREQNAARNMP
ncbi:MAG: sulfatase-like hydrolase/transferase, partial [Planctomycetaceae bacterium]|nr:sulfatase-like hydrolase/transferase [Planctomycetaceae bacterium]